MSSISHITFKPSSQASGIYLDLPQLLWSCTVREQQCDWYGSRHIKALHVPHSSGTFLLSITNSTLLPDAFNKHNKFSCRLQPLSPSVHHFVCQHSNELTLASLQSQPDDRTDLICTHQMWPMSENQFVSCSLVCQHMDKTQRTNGWIL